MDGLKAEPMSCFIFLSFFFLPVNVGEDVGEDLEDDLGEVLRSSRAVELEGYKDGGEGGKDKQGID